MFWKVVERRGTHSLGQTDRRYRQGREPQERVGRCSESGQGRSEGGKGQVETAISRKCDGNLRPAQSKLQKWPGELTRGMGLRVAQSVG